LATVLERSDSLVEPKESEAHELEALSEQIVEMASQRQRAALIGPNGVRVDIPESAFEALLLIVRTMARGQAITLIPQGKELTTQQAADLLHVSRPHLVQLLDRGDIGHHMVGTHRRINIEDVLSFRRQLRTNRQRKLAELTRASEELEGGYS
jgi:excisionase family DNA binding protein